MLPNTCVVLTEIAKIKINSGECVHTLEFTAISEDSEDTPILGDELYKVYV